MSGQVAVPIQYATIRVFVDKGRHWSVVEHLLLNSICERPRTADELAVLANLPIRLVIEALINLMRVGWAEIQPVGERLKFAGTTGGQANVKLETLPPVSRPLTRTPKFAIEQVTGSVLRWREIVFVPPTSKRLQAPGLVKLPVGSNLPIRNAMDIVSSLLEDDERYRGADARSAKPGQGFALVTLTGQKLAGLPRQAPKELRDKVLAAARGRLGAAPPTAPAPVQVGLDPAFLHDVRRASFSVDDLALGGEANWNLLRDMVSRARSILVIHSTFVGTESVDRLLPLLIEAALKRGVTAHILWGKNDHEFQSSPTREAIAHARSTFSQEGLDGFVHVHPFSTKSHAKLIVADDDKGGLAAAVGSCNWLSSRFDAYDVGLRLTDPLLVSDVCGSLAQMAYEATGRTIGLVMDLAGRALNLQRAGESRGRSSARLVCGAEHAQLIDYARDSAQKRIVIASHRLGESAETLSLIPLRAAMKVRPVGATAYFDKVGPPFDEAGAAALVAATDAKNVRFVRGKNLHAKFLAWDDDDVVITSFNLLSADPGSPWSEIGIHLHSPGVAKRLIEDIGEQYDG